jgi:hypothetical protein
MPRDSRTAKTRVLRDPWGAVGVRNAVESGPSTWRIETRPERQRLYHHSRPKTNGAVSKVQYPSSPGVSPLSVQQETAIQSRNEQEQNAIT